jgi:Tol biopolymer transport system component
MRRPPRTLFKLILRGALAASAAASTFASPRPVARASSASSAPARARDLTATNPCGGRLVFDSTREVGDHFEIYSMSADGTGQTRLTNHTAVDLFPSWSPDGSRIVFQSDRDNLASGRSDIYVMNADGTNVRRLTTDAGFDESPAWSPDGTRIAFISTRADRENNNIREIYVMDADGGNQTQITFGANVQPRLSWSPDSSRIAFSAPAGNLPPDILLIYTVSSSGGTVAPLTAPVVPESDVMPAWSPDGRQVAFSRFRSGGVGTAEVYVIDASTGGGLKNLTNAPGDDTVPAWSPDGSSIAFVSNRGGGRDIYLMYPDGSGQVNLTNSPAFFNDRPAWQAPQTAAPCLLTEAGTERAAALHSVALTRDPFSVATQRNLGGDTRTRVALFCRNLRLLPGEDASAVSVTAETSLHTIVNLPVEFVGKVPGFNWLTQVNVKLPNDLVGEGEVLVSVSLRGSQSNRALMNVSAAAEP